MRAYKTMKSYGKKVNMKKRKLIEEGIIDDGMKFMERHYHLEQTIIISLNSTKIYRGHMSSEEICGEHVKFRSIIWSILINHVCRVLYLDEDKFIFGSSSKESTVYPNWDLGKSKISSYQI